MPWYTCTVNFAGPAIDGNETAPPVVYVNLTETSAPPVFYENWFYVGAGGQNMMLAVALAAMNGQKSVQVEATPPNQRNTPYTNITRMYLKAK
jgi:hypothetical protein